MWLSRLAVRNFRNLADVDIPVQPGMVVVGENQTGKSNLLHALRLVMDASLPNTERQLVQEDFWDGLVTDDEPDPMAFGHVIEVVVEFEDFGDDPAALTALSDALIDGDPFRARLTYRFEPREVPEGQDPASAGYHWQIVGGAGRHARPMSTELRAYIHVAFLGALRDAERDLAVWRRSPLRTLLEDAAARATDTELARAGTAIQDANTALADLTTIRVLADAISGKMEDLAGEAQALQTSLGTGPTEPMRLLRTLRLFVGEASLRPLSTASLGALNVLYLALLQLSLDQGLAHRELAHLVLAIEEPEAHLHPHLQRAIFHEVLRPNASTTAIVTTHSPHVASVAPGRSLVVLRSENGRTQAAAASAAQLMDEEWDDIERYLDATRAELVFARGVLLVEGYAEKVVIPGLAEALCLDLDRLGITVCAIHGTHFAPYARFATALKIPWAVVTDGDPNENGERQGLKRATRLLRDLGIDMDDEPASHNIFVGRTTFEYDLFTTTPQNAEAWRAALSSLGRSPTRRKIENWQDDPPDCGKFLDAIRTVGGKGRAAQRVATRQLTPPPYVASALRSLVP
jgi:putative ATP-dependent endonuclease of OLD family